ncbi:class II aldolase/adducin family protein [Novosphingobium mangrovi (ex Hu et al. 2023)]|uniref:Class II aldolase/adducin family protein n=1 Tax=Novosphingobium mangrovi (ex Hu et al. 2023) TaxID=2930094 RepID=A0ABT0AFZ8_9SPHN|nr:class II aldolase/adducin family protein [Novosphingobium mangrovi (ex Hu et al. 2023)]MCJ1962131.1 class II aldolase/adducin family protein [Novosphingobium mangrovi (ex Hu et al. 2023)]
MTPSAQSERELRSQLADFYHLVRHLGWDELVFNHISARLPGAEERYLVNPFGLLYDEITPDNLITVSVEGELVGESEYRANPAGFALHGVIHANRPDVRCVAHTHSIALSAVAMKAAGIDHDNFYGAQLSGRVAYHDFEGITLYADERERMLASIGDKDVLILRNHGVAVCGRDIPSTFALLWIVQRAAEVQLAAGSMAGPNQSLPDAVRQRCAADAHKITSSSNAFGELLFNSAVRQMKLDKGMVRNEALAAVPA